MKNNKYHTVRTILKYHTVRTILKYHTVRTILKSNIKIVERCFYISVSRNFVQIHLCFNGFRTNFPEHNIQKHVIRKFTLCLSTTLLRTLHHYQQNVTTFSIFDRTCSMQALVSQLT